MEGIKLEVGKYYRTRDGRRIFIGGVNTNPFLKSVHYPYMGFLEGEEECRCGWWTEGGLFDETGEHCMDLVAELKEPKRIKGCIYIVEDINGRVETFYAEQEWGGKLVGKPFACIPVDVLEGQGLDGSANNG